MAYRDIVWHKRHSNRMFCILLNLRAGLNMPCFVAVYVWHHDHDISWMVYGFRNNEFAPASGLQL